MYNNSAISGKNGQGVFISDSLYTIFMTAILNNIMEVLMQLSTDAFLVFVRQGIAKICTTKK